MPFKHIVFQTHRITLNLWKQQGYLFHGNRGTKVFIENKGAVIADEKFSDCTTRIIQSIFVLSCQASNFIPLSQKFHFPMFGNCYSLFKYIFIYSLKTDFYSFEEQKLLERKHKAYWTAIRGCYTEIKTNTMFILVTCWEWKETTEKQCRGRGSAG